jgi:FHA domain-containing protein
MPEVRRHQHSPAELKEQLEAQRRGLPFLVYRDGSGEQRIFEIGHPGRLAIGRDARCDVSLEWDDGVSRLHAELQCLNNHWTIADDGLSRNGTFVNGERLRGRRRLRDGDRLRLGQTSLTYRAPQDAPARSTVQIGDSLVAARLTDAQRQVLIALARPYASGDLFATPASNQRIADELHLSLPTVKGHLRALFGKYGIEDLPQQQKRVRLVELGFQSGEISERELAGSP